MKSVCSSIFIFCLFSSLCINFTKSLPTTTSSKQKVATNTPSADRIVENKLSFLAISSFLDSFKSLPTIDEAKIENKHRRELGLNKTAVSRIASQGYGLFNSLMQLASNANTIKIQLNLIFKYFTVYSIYFILYNLITNIN